MIFTYLFIVPAYFISINLIQLIYIGNSGYTYSSINVLTLQLNIYPRRSGFEMKRLSAVVNSLHFVLRRFNKVVWKSRYQKRYLMLPLMVFESCCMFHSVPFRFYLFLFQLFDFNFISVSCSLIWISRNSEFLFVLRFPKLWPPFTSHIFTFNFIFHSIVSEIL